QARVVHEGKAYGTVDHTVDERDGVACVDQFGEARNTQRSELDVIATLTGAQRDAFVLALEFEGLRTQSVLGKVKLVRRVRGPGPEVQDELVVHMQHGNTILASQCEPDAILFLLLMYDPQCGV